MSHFLLKARFSLTPSTQEPHQLSGYSYVPTVQVGAGVGVKVGVAVGIGVALTIGVGAAVGSGVGTALPVPLTESSTARGFPTTLNGIFALNSRAEVA